MLWFAFCSVVRLPSSFVILMSRWISPIQNLCFYFVFSFHYRKESFLKPSDVLMWYFSCSWAHRFVVFCFFLLCFPPLFFPRSRYTFAGGIVEYFWMIIFFWLDDAGWTRGVLILLGVRCVFVFCVNEDEQTFSFLQVYNTSWQVAVFAIIKKQKTEVTEICTCGWRVISRGYAITAPSQKALFINVIWRLPDPIDGTRSNRARINVCESSHGFDHNLGREFQRSRRAAAEESMYVVVLGSPSEGCTRSEGTRLRLPSLLQSVLWTAVQLDGGWVGGRQPQFAPCYVPSGGCAPSTFLIAGQIQIGFSGPVSWTCHV